MAGTLGQPALSRRHFLIATLAVASFVVLVGRLWALQVGGATGYDEVASGNRTRTVTLEAARGRILDARGRELAVSEPVLTVTLDWQALIDLGEERRTEIWHELATELGAAGHELSAPDLDRRYRDTVGRDLRATVLVAGIDTALWVALEERGLPGIGVEERLSRRYPNGTLAAHVVGHLGSVASPDEAAQLNEDVHRERDRYQPGDVIGRSGIEQHYEAELRGTPEILRVEVDAIGRVVRTIDVVQQAEPGMDVRLTVDLDVQAAAETAIAAQLEAARNDIPSCAGCPPQHAPAGSIVALRPSDGAVVAMASYPSFDPQWFAGGHDEILAGVLVDPDRPLLNRAIAGQYPPGSTFKPVVAYASVTSGFRAPDERWLDVGQHRLADCRPVGDDGCIVRNAGGTAMGEVDLAAALARSSDTYFYSVGEGLWTGRDRFGRTPVQDVATAWGLGARSGLVLGGEADGAVPVPDELGWFAGDNVNLAIGQGDLLVTPLQLAQVYATLASDGRRHPPNLVDAIVDPARPAAGDHTANAAQGTGSTRAQRPAAPDPAGARSGPASGSAVSGPGLDPVARKAIEAGLARATTSGTAASAFAGFPLSSHPIAGKTGTAQVDGKADFSLFAGYGLDADLDLTVAVVLEEAGWGSAAAAPAARAVFEAVLAGAVSP